MTKRTHSNAGTKLAWMDVSSASSGMGEFLELDPRLAFSTNFNVATNPESPDATVTSLGKSLELDAELASLETASNEDFAEFERKLDEDDG